MFGGLVAFAVGMIVLLCGVIYDDFNAKRRAKERAEEQKRRKPLSRKRLSTVDPHGSKNRNAWSKGRSGKLLSCRVK